MALAALELAEIEQMLAASDAAPVAAVWSPLTYRPPALTVVAPV